MSKDVFVRRFRPYLFSGFKRSQYLPARAFASKPYLRAKEKQQDVTHDYEKRVAQLQAYRPLSECYPRLENVDVQDSAGKKAFKSQYEHLEVGINPAADSLLGRIHSIRTAGSKLLFIDVKQPDGTLQVVCQLGKLQDGDGNITSEVFKGIAKIARKGDVYEFTGWPHRTARGELSLLATDMPTLLSPSLHQIPEAFEDPEARARARHVDMLVNPDAIRTLRVRHEVDAGLQEYFNDRGFTRVYTPILGAGAGGATARPFETEATEFNGEKLNLRIAPELWLKRLIVGGMHAVYEIGPAFRNEGVDATHNPEFNICEFYKAYTTLDDLMRMTASLLLHLSSHVKDSSFAVDALKTFEEVEFIPGLQSKLQHQLPDLQSPRAQEQVLAIFDKYELVKPSNPTLPRLLDTLAAYFLEPLSNENNPTFITHHPACLSPLSKHFTCPQTGQIVAARAELFINGREYANMYEEENSPFEQRRKFEEQLKQRETDAEAMELDENYLQVLEWGMPPTGGWGCGVDRLVMLFSGRERMADVLPFGSLRNVVGLGSGKRK
ncbi:hypothetical protein M409DRAFT_64520 [Zasmidium cellare ATCC 36951]|uniref:Lysyl-tRNA synthetase n=1 Tax=Zasmidium cellare ATCC 36951 TaxID=1080233 RepID=A0A6A6CWI5_ZASCE|nr:uncharacterized protein M409DRAFT_64520 [Zasmidium cellare ATCC 36951]KAF2170182.1 hypothetical protein M409DRAFT_64520 [Zasmidium cellare ATCC 36951]